MHIFSLVVLLFISICSSAAESATAVQNRQATRRPPQIDSARLKDFAARKIDTEDGPLQYREAFIDVQEGSSPALVIYLHGASGRGDDNLRQMRQAGIYAIQDYMKKHGIRGYLLVPQCPATSRWLGYQRGKPSTGPVKRLVNLYLDKGLADRSRVYILGASMGGGGTWKLIHDMPGVFAAALVASGDYRGGQFQSLSSTPAYMTVGEEEGAERVQAIRRLAKNIGDAGGEVRLVVLPGLDHKETCVQSFSNAGLAWVFKHRRGTATSSVTKRQVLMENQ
jgi:predicted peptidase